MTPLATETDGKGVFWKPTKTTGRPLGLYLHIPFCEKKCPYCHFFVLPAQKALYSDYTDLLLQELSLKRELLEQYHVRSLYLGGGTPSLLPLQEYRRLFKALPYPFQEITLEVNPENSAPDLFKGYLELGINRLSIGVQSLDETLLKKIGRVHSAQKAVECVMQASSAGFKNITLDLMYDLPYQTLDSWKKTVSRALDLPITHFSLYNLTFEKGSSYFHQQKKLQPHLPSEEISLQMLQWAVTQAAEKGFNRYEISAFSKPSFEAIHNKGYWHYEEYLGIGPSAFSFIEGERFQNIPHYSKYVQRVSSNQDPKEFSEKLPPSLQLKEKIALGLRLQEGIYLQDVKGEIRENLEQLKQEGFLQEKDQRWKLTHQGILFHDLVASELM